ncbi:MAG: response regulator transcription factor [Methylococcaceae bacterium]|nr:response regulator transcription factor [Methylococcaceae bacterium]
MTGAEITILLADDHAIVREGYRALLSKQANMAIVAEAADGNEAYQLYKHHEPDVTILDISMPGPSGIETIHRIRQRCPTAKILVFTMHQNHRFAEQALKAGALGYVTKSSPPEELLNAIQDVRAGRRVLSPDIAQALALEKTGGDCQETLTPREFEILRLLAAGKSKEETANLLNLSPKTVANCHYLIKSKLGVASDIELTHWAIKMDLVDSNQTSK